MKLHKINTYKINEKIRSRKRRDSVKAKQNKQNRNQKVSFWSVFLELSGSMKFELRAGKGKWRYRAQKNKRNRAFCSSSPRIYLGTVSVNSILWCSVHI